jgi:arsenate reductase (thioredoxin)
MLLKNDSMAVNLQRYQKGATMQSKTKVLFLSKGNATRSQMVQGFLQALAADRFVGCSAGVEPGGLSPLAIKVMREVGVDISKQESKSVAQVLKEHFGYVITFCDLTRERAPIFPFTFHLLHWSVVDPHAVTGPDFVRREAFRHVRDDIEAKVRFFLDGAVENDLERGVLVYAAHQA